MDRGYMRIFENSVPDAVYAAGAPTFSEKELADLTLAVIAISGWNRLAIPFRAPVRLRAGRE
jgi:alkylhydroperoxidase family enzyme